MIRIVSTGDLGLDVLLGGGWRLVKRFEGLESATIVIRGGGGAGKTLLGIQVAIELARALDGDVIVGCVEILPTEYIAQLQSARPGYESDRVAILPGRAVSEAPSRIYIGLLSELDAEQPNLVDALRKLEEAAIAAGAKPKVFIVDSLIEGYGIGSSAPRIDVDDTLRFATQYGYGLVLCEEVRTDEPSAWVFAADTVLQVGTASSEPRRWIEVTKHRFGPSATGRHELELAGACGPEVFPGMEAWRPLWVPSVLVTHGWPVRSVETPSRPLRWDGSPDVQGALIVITSQEAQLAQSFAEALRPSFGDEVDRDACLMFRFDALSHRVNATQFGLQQLTYLPVAMGPVRILRTLVEQAARMYGASMSSTRIVIGDLAQVPSSSADVWIEVVRTFAALVNASEWGLSVIAYDTDSARDVALREALRSVADVFVSLVGWDRTAGNVVARMHYRWARTSIEKGLAVPGLASDRLPRPPGRS